MIAAGHEPAGSLRTDIAAWIVLTAGVSVAVVLASGRAVFGTWLPVRPLAVAVPLIGVAVAVAEELLLHEWAEARFGHYDSELVWWTAALSGLVVATSIACFGTLVAPHGARLAPMVCQALATLAVAIVVASNLDGLRDGVRPESVLLATAVGLCGLYAVAATLGSWLIAWRAE